MDGSPSTVELIHALASRPGVVMSVEDDNDIRLNITGQTLDEAELLEIKDYIQEMGRNTQKPQLKRKAVDIDGEEDLGVSDAKLLKTNDNNPQNDELEYRPEGLSEAEYELLNMQRTLSGRECHRQRKDVFTSHGHFNKKYRHLSGLVVREKKGAGGSNGRVTNRPWVSTIRLNGNDIQAGYAERQDKEWKRIIIAFTRASSHPPTYGAEGMFERGVTAARAWSRLQSKFPAFIFSIPRARIRSSWCLSDPRALVGEMVSILNAAADGTTVELLSVGVNGLTTNINSFVWLNDTWGARLEISIIFIVPEEYPGTPDAFPTFSNGIRYGVFQLDNIIQALLNSPTRESFPNECELVEQLDYIRKFKEDRMDGYAQLTNWTSGRANFRVSADHQYDSGVNEAARQSRGLH